MLTAVTTSLPTPRNLIYNVFDSMEVADDASFRVENWVVGDVINLGALTNISGVYYNKFTHRVGFIQNNTATVYEYTYAALKAATVSSPPTLLRTIAFTGLDGDDTEGCCNIIHNYAEGGFENWICDENGGANRVYNIPWTFDEMFSESNISIAARRRLTNAANGLTNDGTEDVEINKWEQEIHSVQEGATGTRVYRVSNRPTNRDVSYVWTDPELTVDETRFDATSLPAGDQAGLYFHHATGHSVILSESGNALRQVTTDGNDTLVSSLSLGTAFDQPEGVTMGPNMEGIIASETDSFAFLTYVAP